MQGKHLKGKTIEYDGSQLSPLWGYQYADLVGDSIISFRGPCNLGPEDMVDLEDKKKGSVVSSPDMLHFILEYFNNNLEQVLMLRRLLVTVLLETLRDSGIYDEVDLERDHNNIYAYLSDDDERYKLTISEATVNPVSGLVHLGINLNGEGAPVRAAGLEEIGIEDVDRLAIEVLRRFVEEVQSLKNDAAKIRPIT